MRLRRALRGSVNVAWLAFLASIVIFVALVTLLAWDWDGGPDDRPREPLVVYCAAGLKVPVEAAASEYEREYGVPVQLQFGGSLIHHSGLIVKAVLSRLVTRFGAAMLDFSLIEAFL